MDNVTHTLTGLALSQAGLNRYYAPRPALVLMLAANIPDIDIVTLSRGSLTYFEVHRGWTHTILMAPVMALLPVLIACLVGKTMRGWTSAWAISLIGVASHLLLDWTNAYGIRFLMPFSSTWYHLDLNNLSDLWILAVLVLAAVAPLIGRLVSSEIGAPHGKGRGWAMFALSFFLLYDFGRFLTHQRALETLNSRVYMGHPPIRVAAFPVGAGNPFAWAGWVEGEDFFVHFPMNLLRDFDPSSGNLIYKAAPSDALQAARNAPSVQAFLDFSQYPIWRVVPASEPEGARRVEVRDWRFPFTASAVVDTSGRVVSSSFHY